MATSGAVTEWFRRLVGDASHEELSAAAAAAPEGSERLVALPYFAGERTPLFDPDAHGLLLGLTLNHSRGHLYWALLESVAFGVRHNLETICEASGQPRRLVAIRGGARTPLWVQIVSDVTGEYRRFPR
jgi:xylulokinase